jgi:hypothetical protein
MGLILGSSKRMILYFAVAWHLSTYTSSMTYADAQTSASNSINSSEGAPRTWAEAAVENEFKIISNEDRQPIRFRQHKVDAKGDTTREIIVSKQGNVARLVERDGKPLTNSEDAAERDRLNAEIASPEDFEKHRRRDSSIREDVLGLVKLLPEAMLYSYAPGQPQEKGNSDLQVVLDFHPDPSFHPPTMMADLLTGLAGRVWIDKKSHCMTRIEAHILHPVNFGFGVLAKIFPGGTVEFEQTRAVGDTWMYSHLEEHLTARLLMVKTVPQNSIVTSFDFRLMPAMLDYQDAIRVLLALPVALR